MLFFAISPHRSIYGNAGDLIAVALNLAAGRGFADQSGQPDTYFNPGYPTLLALASKLAPSVILGAKGLNLLCDMGTAALLSRLLAPLAGAEAALLFATLFGFHPLFLHLCNNIDDEPALTLMLATAVSLLWLGLSTHRRFWYALSGLAFAAGALIKSSVVALPAFLAIVFISLEIAADHNQASRALRRWGLLLAAFVLSLVPWVLRNRIVTGVPTFGVRGIAVNLFWGSDSRIFMSYGSRQRRVLLNLKDEYRRTGIAPADSSLLERERWHFRMAAANYRRLIRKPTELLTLVALKLPRPFFATEDRPSAHVALLALQAPLLVLGLRGLWRLGRAAPQLGLLLASVVGYFYLAGVAAMPLLRYFAPAFVLMLLALPLAVIRPAPAVRRELSAGPSRQP